MDCIFCGEYKTSKEHIWGRWLQEIYPIENVGHTSKHWEDRNNEAANGKIELARGHFEKGEHPFQMTSKVVCALCNNTWMSQIETEMMNLTKRIILENTVRCSFDDFLAITRWCFLKFCVHEAAQEFLAPEELYNLGLVETFLRHSEKARRDRNRKFYKIRNVPAGYYVFLGRRGYFEATASMNLAQASAITVYPSGEMDLIERRTTVGHAGSLHFVVSNQTEVIDFVKSRFNPPQPIRPPLVHLDNFENRIEKTVIETSLLEDEVMSVLDVQLPGQRRRSHKGGRPGKQSVIRPRRRS
ncbi:hypothetical protein [Phaeobacter inhibens]|uniref:hypothetical protein n=1 Tax=Phaeobacter inhibens TaxID=221822 RepID=UPI0021A3636D|nr:hypothetical protein [Phaeobacter inhibens]UWR74085.1 hypothetical protein K4L00_08270 [Phaeobacter inhibens]